MGLIQTMQGNHKTVAEIADHALSSVIAEGDNSPRINVVFDVYLENSIKGAERVRRGESESTEFKNLSSDHTFKQWRKFLVGSRNKENLIKTITDEWRHPQHQRRFVGRVMYVTCGETCYELSELESMIVDELKSTQEEADTRLLHAVCSRSRRSFMFVVAMKVSFVNQVNQTGE